MQVFEDKKQLDFPLSSSVVTIGNFDGVHRGHQQLIQTVVREAQYFDAPSAVYTFHPHPVKILRPEKATFRLFDLKDQQEQFQKNGIDYVFIEEFTKEFSQVTPQFFLEKYIFEKLHPKTLVVGHDFSFGAGRAGNIPFLENFCAQNGTRLIIIPPYYHQGSLVSSSLIRSKLQQGEVAEANDLLGRSYYLRGHVEKGFQRGRTIGVPTANIHPDVEFMPRRGVYCTLTELNGKLLPSITNIGVNPTVSSNSNEIPQVKIESHIFDFDQQIYGFEVAVHLLQFVRDEIKFSDFTELKKQIQNDMTWARRYFDEKAKN